MANSNEITHARLLVYQVCVHYMWYKHNNNPFYDPVRYINMLQYILKIVEVFNIHQE